MKGRAPSGRGPSVSTVPVDRSPARDIRLLPRVTSGFRTQINLARRPMVRTPDVERTGFGPPTHSARTAKILADGTLAANRAVGLTLVEKMYENLLAKLLT